MTHQFVYCDCRPCCARRFCVKCLGVVESGSHKVDINTSLTSRDCPERPK